MPVIFRAQACAMQASGETTREAHIDLIDREHVERNVIRTVRPSAASRGTANSTAPVLTDASRLCHEGHKSTARAVGRRGPAFQVLHLLTKGCSRIRDSFPSSQPRKPSFYVRKQTEGAVSFFSRTGQNARHGFENSWYFDHGRQPASL